MKGFPIGYKLQVYGAILSFIALGLIIVLSILFLLIKLIQPNITTVVLLNFYGEEIIVELDNKTIPLDVMEITRIKVRNLSSDNYISVKNIAGEEIDKVGALELSDSPNLVIEPLHKSKQFCFFKANVTDFYYFIGEEESDVPHLTEIELLEKVNRDSNSRITTDDNYLVYPGKASTEDLPKTLAHNKKVYGIYPIPCSDLTDLDMMKNTVFGFKHYNEEEGREFVEQRLREIEDIDLSDVSI